MGLFDRIKKAIGGGEPPGRDLEELAIRLGLEIDQIRATEIEYRDFEIPKRSGGSRRITAPAPDLKRLQRRILRRLLARLAPHPAATGFEPGYSIVSHAFGHRGKALVIRLDLVDFFPSIPESRIHGVFAAHGWGREASDLLTRLTTWGGRLPQGAPTSPKLSNLACHRMDARLTGLAEKLSAYYSRYADDLTFSFEAEPGYELSALLRAVREIVADEGHRVHIRRKLRVRRRHQRQLVTGLVVNQSIQLPRETRRWLASGRTSGGPPQEPDPDRCPAPGMAIAAAHDRFPDPPGPRTERPPVASR